MGCGMSIETNDVDSDSKAIESIPIRTDILANIGVGSVIPLKNKYDEDVYNATRDYLTQPILYCHICRKTGIYYTGKLFIDNSVNFNSKIKYICSFHLEKKNITDNLL